MAVPTDPSSLPSAGSDDTALTLVLGILGGIASGKSVVARLLAGPKGRVIAADELAHEVLASPEVAARVREAFGDEVFDADGRPDRRALAARVFAAESGEAARRRLESWIHPPVRARILECLAEARAQGVPLVVLDVPLLLENDTQHRLVRECAELVFVEVDADERARRAGSTRGWSPDELARRESLQLPLDEKKRRADHVIPNNGNLEALARAVRSLRATLGLS